MPDTQNTSRRRLACLRGVDTRTRFAKRVKEFATVFSDALGGWDKLNPLQQHKVEEAAMLSALAEHTQKAALAGHSEIGPDDAIRAANAAQRARRELNIELAAPKAPTLADYLAEANQ